VAKSKSLISFDDARKILEHEALLKAEMERGHRLLFPFVREYGGLSFAGLHCYQEQTIGAVYNVELVAEVLTTIIIGTRKTDSTQSMDKWDKTREMLLALLNCVEDKTLKGRFIERGEYSPQIQAMLNEMDFTGSGGLIERYGDAKIDVRPSPPIPGEHYVIGPGMQPKPKYVLPEGEKPEEDQADEEVA